MAPQLEPIKRFKCTYKDCMASFDSEKAMRRHKRDDPDHDFCEKCNEDFDSYDDLAQHKAFRPDVHHKACRVCGQEFKSTSGLCRHIELNHKIDQKIPCLGCGEEFHRASLMVEHLEFGNCPVIAPQQFIGHIVHKHLITELLKGGQEYDRFMQKISKFDAAQDFEVEGGVELDDSILDNEHEAQSVNFDAIKPEIVSAAPTMYSGSYPPLPSSTGDVESNFASMSIADKFESATVAGSQMSRESDRQVQAWGGRASKHLFPDPKSTAKSTTNASEFSLSYHDEQIEKDHGINIMTTTFWDPLNDDWNPERFFDAFSSRYYCPFICEQTFETANDMKDHIILEHRITRMKCPSCLKYFKSVTALMAHCESHSTRCQINKADDFNIFLDKMTGGFLSVREKTRPDHMHNPTVMITNPDTGRPETYTPPTANYLQYSSSRPIDWKEPKKVAEQIGGGPTAGVFEYKSGLAKW